MHQTVWCHAGENLRKLGYNVCTFVWLKLLIPVYTSTFYLKWDKNNKSSFFANYLFSIHSNHPPPPPPWQISWRRSWRTMCGPWRCLWGSWGWSSVQGSSEPGWGGRLPPKVRSSPSWTLTASVPSAGSSPCWHASKRTGGTTTWPCVCFKFLCG